MKSFIFMLLFGLLTFTCQAIPMGYSAIQEVQEFDIDCDVGPSTVIDNYTFLFSPYIFVPPIAEVDTTNALAKEKEPVTTQKIPASGPEYWLGDELIRGQA